MNLTNILKQLREELDAVKERILALERIEAGRSQQWNGSRLKWIADVKRTDAPLVNGRLLAWPLRATAEVKKSSKQNLRAGSG
jgi:hypothetical protein